MSVRHISIISIVSPPFDIAAENEVGEELKAYLLAIYTYPDHVARRRQLSFQKHLRNVIRVGRRRPSGHVRPKTLS